MPTFRTLVLGVLVAAAGLAGCGDNAESVARARKLIEAEASVVFAAAHPTAGTPKEVRFDGNRASPNGMVLTYSFLWGKPRKEDGKPKHQLVLEFQADAEGRFASREVEDVIKVVSDTALVKPFLAAQVGAAALRVKLQKQLDALPDGANDELKKVAQQKLSAKALAGLWLKYRELHPE